MFMFFVCVAIGYLVGCVNPAWIISKIRNADLQRKGSKNLGATNAFMVLGKRTGIFIMIFDIIKALIAVKIAKILFPMFAAAGAVTGAAVIIGHIFPFYLGFRGGKGLACLGGVVLGLDWEMFIPLLIIGITAAFITNYACALPISAATIFPIAYGVRTQSIAYFFILSASSVCIAFRHVDNIRGIRNGTEVSVRDYFSRDRNGV